jgi:Protein of unknown function (DUF1402)
MRIFALFAAVVAVLLVATNIGYSAAVAKQDVIVVPADYHAKRQPTVFAGSSLLTAIRGSGGFKEKYARVYSLFSRDKALVAKIKKAAATYSIDPIHIIGAIVGEHTYNIDVFDSLQAYYVKALEYTDPKSISFQYNGESAAKFFTRPQFSACQSMKSNYELWDCRQTVWNNSFFGRFVDGRRYPTDRLHRVFFRPMGSGLTFGIGQLSPVAALMVTDLTHAKSGRPLLTVDNAPQVYQEIMNPDDAIIYIAAQIRVSIDMYRNIAGFDISQNPGLTATLYNLGDAATRARQLKAENDQRKAKGQPPLFPQENFYGWFVNEKADELRKLL